MTVSWRVLWTRRQRTLEGEHKTSHERREMNTQRRKKKRKKKKIHGEEKKKQEIEYKKVTSKSVSNSGERLMRFVIWVISSDDVRQT